MKRLVWIVLLLYGGMTWADTHLETIELDGEWAGFITQDPAGLDSLYEFKATFQTDGDNLSGQTYFSFIEGARYYGFLRFEGVRRGNQIELRELEVVNEYMRAMAYWCLKTFELEVAYFEGRIVITGTWKSDDCSGSTGRAYLERTIS